MGINSSGNGHVETLQRTPKTHLVVATHTFFELHQILVSGRLNIIYPNSWEYGVKEAGQLLHSVVPWQNRSVSTDVIGNAHRFHWSCISILPFFQSSYFAIVVQSMAYGAFSKDSLSAQCCLQVFHRFHYFYYILSCNQSYFDFWFTVQCFHYSLLV